MEVSQNVLQDILETVQFLKDNAVTKDDLVNFATKDDIYRLDQKIDDLRTDMNARFDEVVNEICDVKARLARLEKQTKEDLDVYASEIVSLKEKVKRLEQQVAVLLKQTA